MSNLHFTLLWRQSDWGFYGRRNEVFAHELASRSDVGNVLHVEPVSMPELGRYARKWMKARRPAFRQAYAKQLVKALPHIPFIKVKENLYITSVVVLANRDFLTPVRWINQWLVHFQMLQIRRIRSRSFGKGCHCTIAYVPSAYLSMALDVLPADIVVADLIDDVLAQVNDPRRRQLLKRSYVDVLPRCACAFATSPHVARKFQHYSNSGIDVIRNGVYVDGSKSPEQSNIQTVGYVGMINHTMNVELVEFVVKQFPSVHFKLAGPVHPDLENEIAFIRKQENVEFLGPLLKSEVPPFLRECTVLMSFKRSDDVTAGNDSMKIYEYLASGRPIVSTPVAPADRLSHVVYTADNPAEFVKQLNRALNESDPACQEARLQEAKDNAWKHRINTFTEKVKSYL